MGQASITSRDVLIEKISANTEFKLSFTSPSIEELASSFRTDSHQSTHGSFLHDVEGRLSLIIWSELSEKFEARLYYVHTLNDSSIGLRSGEYGGR